MLQSSNGGCGVGWLLSVVVVAAATPLLLGIWLCQLPAQRICALQAQSRQQCWLRESVMIMVTVLLSGMCWLRSSVRLIVVTAGAHAGSCHSVLFFQH